MLKSIRCFVVYIIIIVLGPVFVNSALDHIAAWANVRFKVDKIILLYFQVQKDSPSTCLMLLIVGLNCRYSILFKKDVRRL